MISSQHAIAAVATAATENHSVVRASRLRSQTGKCTDASVRQAAAIIDQTMTTKLTDPPASDTIRQPSAS
jgi:hypothetical protein